MNNNSQLNNDFPAGFLIKDKSGQFKKVNDDKIEEFQSASQNNPTTKTNPNLNQITQEDISLTSAENSNKFEKIEEIDNTHQPAPKPPLAPTRANFIAEPDDDTEIRNHQEELNKILSETTGNIDKPKYNSEEITNDLLSKYAITFESDIYQKRFQKIVESRLKEIRSAIEAEEVLKRAKKIGGLELDEEQAKNIISELDDKISQIHQNSAVTPEKDIQTAPASSGQENEQARNKTTILGATPPSFIPMPVAKEKLTSEPTVSETKPLEPVSANLVKDVQPEIEKTPEQLLEETKQQQIRKDAVNKLYAKTPSESMAKIAKSRQVEIDRPQVIDIRQPSITLGPVEEIGEIDTKEFRRMGDNPSGSAEKILEKLYLLEEDSWEQRMNGLQAWQQSPIYKLYVEIGKESIKENIPVDQIINQREAVGKQNLHFEEFLAINSLNNQLVI